MRARTYNNSKREQEHNKLLPDAVLITTELAHNIFYGQKLCISQGHKAKLRLDEPYESKAMKSS